VVEENLDHVNIPIAFIISLDFYDPFSDDTRNRKMQIFAATYSAKALAEVNVVAASQRANNEVGKVMAQMDMIRAQENLKQAEYNSHSVCPRKARINALEAHQKQQMIALQKLRAELLGSGFTSLVVNHGIRGIHAYVVSGFPKVFNKWI
jgi:hypothetical protein